MKLHLTPTNGLSILAIEVVAEAEDKPKPISDVSLPQ
jgi:hypothetical protein